MRRMLFWMAVIVPFVMSCDKRDNEGLQEEMIDILDGLTFSAQESRNETFYHSNNDSEWQKMNDALNYLPADKYEASWEHKDSLLVFKSAVTDNLNIRFREGEAFATMTTTTTNSVRNAEIYIYHYRFLEPYHEETSYYMMSISTLGFVFYNKLNSTRLEYKLDDNLSFDLTSKIWSTYAPLKEMTETDKEEQRYSYSYNKDSDIVDLTRNNIWACSFSVKESSDGYLYINELPLYNRVWRNLSPVN